MEPNPLAGDIQIELVGNGISAAVLALYPFRADGSETTREDILVALKVENVQYGISMQAIDYWLHVAQQTNTAPEHCVVAHYTPALRKGTLRLDFTVPCKLTAHDKPGWEIVSRYFAGYALDKPYLCETPLCFVHEGQAFARQTEVREPEQGMNIFGEPIPINRGQNIEYKAGEGVYLDHKTGVFTSGFCGYLMFKDFVFSVQEAFHVSRDRMKLFFLNLPRESAQDHASDKEMYNYCQRQQILYDQIGKVEWDMFPFHAHPLLAEGKQPGISTEASVQTFFSKEGTIGEMDDKGRIDYKEQHKFNSIGADVLLATKKLAIKGEDGRDLFGKSVPAPVPRDVIFKAGRGTRTEKTETEMSVYSAEEGVLEYENNIISVFPQVTVRGDVGMETGHIDSSANIEVMGSVLAGFNVHSKKNIFIRGNIEDHCVIECGGDLMVGGGVSGEHTKITCQGNFSAKYVETCQLEVVGKAQVQRFIRGAKVVCHDTIIVFGQGINLNERGAIVDAEIRVRNELHVPVVGSEAGLRTYVEFAYDKALATHIEQLNETVAKILASIEELNEGLPVNINNPNVYSEMQSLDAKTKALVIERIQAKNKCDGRLTMMRKILADELAKRDEMLRHASVQISKKVIPDLVLRCNDLQRTIDQVEPPSRFYFDMQTRLIERTMFGITDSPNP